MSAPAAANRARPLRSPRAAARELSRVVSTHVVGGAARAAQRATRRGAHGAPITTGPDRTVLLFYEDVEADRLVPNDRYVRRAARRAYHAVTAGQSVSGFEIAFRMLRTALERAGCRVVVNNPALARRHPDHPVGICGYPHVLDRWSLPNPAVLGPGLFDHPSQAPRLMDDARFRSYLVPCAWYRDVFAPQYGDRCALWFGGIDTDAWPDLAAAPKDIDFLVYDKIRWNREALNASLMQPLLATLAERGQRVHVLRRGAYDLAEYRALLGRARGVLFVCEHETQGLAYQEAMACNVPILAWDPGEWLDPQRAAWTPDPVPASSVPFFDARCGERFADAAEFSAALDRFLARRAEYAPRAYVGQHLSFEESARLYLAAYTAAARR
ncbi:glycosyl transferase [Gemmatimonadetes bacterium T265]|nr:glycosyl transferase [Gemmatimonadetes bacterium T265]